MTKPRMDVLLSRYYGVYRYRRRNLRMPLRNITRARKSAERWMDAAKLQPVWSKFRRKRRTTIPNGAGGVRYVK